MDIFEKRRVNKVTLDDTVELTCVITTSQKVNDHIEYVLRVQRGHSKENSWQILRRYNDFVALNKCLESSGIDLPLPKKKFIGNMRQDFIAERRLALQEYINTVLMNPILASSLPTKKFIDPDNYTTPFHDTALQNATLCLRVESQYLIGVSYGAIGWRIRKHYFKVTQKPLHFKGSQSSSGQNNKFLVKSSSQPPTVKSFASNGSSAVTDKATSNASNELILAWTEFGPDKFIDEREILNVFKNLAGIQHPYIEPFEYLITNESGILVVRKFNNTGSLKDILCGTQPRNTFMAKYGNPKGRSPIPLKDIALYTRQILEAIRFLHGKGLPVGHIHAGNVVIVNGTARLVDYENFLIGVPSFYRPYFVQHGRIHTAEAIDVYSFGHLLFELVMGYPLQESIVRTVTDCPESLKNLLESILSKEASRNGLPTLEQLANHQFYSEFAPGFAASHTIAINNCKPHLKFSSVAKEQIKMCVQKCEARLRDEQKSVKNQKRLVRVQELMSSEEEKRKIKHKNHQHKIDQRQAKLRQQSSLQLQNGASSSVDRSDSVNSVPTSQETIPTPPPLSAGIISPVSKLSHTTPPSPMPPPIPAARTFFPSSGTVEGNETGRSELLDSICNFNKMALRKVASSD